MKSKTLLTLGLFLFLSVAWCLPDAISQGTLHDDFTKTTIDPLKWDSWELVREIQQLPVKGGPPDGKLVSKVTAYGYGISNYLNFKNPDSINYIEADVVVNSIADKYKDEANRTIPRARLIGYFYNDGNPAGGTGSQLGEVQGAIGIRKCQGKLQIHWGVTKYKDAAGASWDTIAEGNLTVQVALKQIYRLFIQFDPPTKTFTFGVQVAKGKPLSPPVIATYTVGDTINNPNVPWKAIGTQVRFDIGSASLASFLSGSISATFDNVLAGIGPGNTQISESFSSSPLDTTKWDTQEYARETPKGKLRSETRSVNRGAVNAVPFKNPQKVKDFRANVTVNSFSNPDGCSTRARLGGYFYNADGPPDPARGYQGEVWAEIYIGGRERDPKASWSVSRSTTVQEGGGWQSLGSGDFPVSITLGQTYNLFMGWDGTKIMFSITENESTHTAEYTIATSVYPPNHNNKGLSTRVFPPSPAPANYEASVFATFDDVIINQTGLPIDGSWLVDITGLAKGGAILDFFTNKFSGYGASGDSPFKIDGEYVVDSSGNINGTFTAYDFFSGVPDDSGTITGKVDSKVAKLNLTVRSVDMEGGSVNMAGASAPETPVIPRDWTVKVSPGGEILDTFTIEPYHDDDGKFYPRVFVIYASIYDPRDDITTEINGGFLLGAKNKIYGSYSVDGFDDGRPYREDGVLSGTITLSPSPKFTMTAISEDKRSKVTLSGIPAE